MLVQYTQQGIHNVNDTTKRADAFKKESASKFGIKVCDMLWTLGEYDMITTVEAPNDETMAACSLHAAKLGNVKIKTLRAFEAAEVEAFLGKV
jgi:uncharacterized protein with GYD domain